MSSGKTCRQQNRRHFGVMQRAEVSPGKHLLTGGQCDVPFVSRVDAVAAGVVFGLKLGGVGQAGYGVRCCKEVELSPHKPK